MHHRNGQSVRRCDHVDLAVYAKLTVRDDHGEIRGACGHVARVHAHAVRRRHAGSCVTLAGGGRDAGQKIAVRIQETRARFGQRAGILAGDQNLGQNVTQTPGITRLRDERVKLFAHPGIIVQSCAVDGEHAGGVADAEDALAREHAVDVSGQGGEIVQLRQMGLFFEHRLIKMRDAPSLRDVEAKEPGELFGGLSRDGVAPGAEGDEQLSVFVKGQIAVHHRGDAQRAHMGQRLAKLFLHVFFQISVAALQALVNLLERIGPDAVREAVFPAVAAGCDRLMFFVK